MYKIASIGLGVGMFLATLAPAYAVEKRPHPRYEGRTVYEGRSVYAPAPLMTMTPYRYRGGCFVTLNPTDETRGIRHWSPSC